MASKKYHVRFLLSDSRHLHLERMSYGNRKSIIIPGDLWTDSVYCRPTCLFLAAKTTNFPIPIDTFVNQIAKLTASDVLDTEFLVAQSLSFEFWARGAEKPLRGWSLEFQVWGSFLDINSMFVPY